MKRAFWLLPLLLVLLACGPSTPTFPSADAPVNTAVPAPADSDESEPDPTGETAVDTAETVPPPAPGLTDFVPATTSEEASQVRTRDWRKGGTEPAVVIIEYGDFQ